MIIKNIADIDLCYFAEQRYKMFDSAWRGILPDSWLNKITKQSTLKNISNFNKNGYKLYMMFTDNNLPCGYVMFGNYRESDNERDGEIMSIYFFKEYHGKGYAKELFSFAEKELMKDHNKIFIWVLEINGRARRFYAKNGYVDTGNRRIQNCDKPYSECLYMKEIKI